MSWFMWSILETTKQYFYLVLSLLFNIIFILKYYYCMKSIVILRKEEPAIHLYSCRDGWPFLELKAWSKLMDKSTVYFINDCMHKKLIIIKMSSVNRTKTNT